MKIAILRSLFLPRLAEHVPGVKRVYKNIFGQTVRTIERKEAEIPNVQPGKISDFILGLDSAGIKDKDAIVAMDRITATQKPIQATTFIVKDRDGILERVNTSLSSGDAALRYYSSFFRNNTLVDSCAIPQKPKIDIIK